MPYLVRVRMFPLRPRTHLANRRVLHTIELGHELGCHRRPFWCGALHSLNRLEWNPTADCQAILRERIHWRRRQLSRRAIRRADPDPRLAERPEDRRHTKLRERLGAVRQICPPLIWSPRPPPVLRDRISRHRHGCSRINPKRPCHTPAVAIERGKRHEQPVAAKDGERAAPVVIAGLFRGCLPALPAHGDDVQRKHQTGGDERQGR